VNPARTGEGWPLTDPFCHSKSFPQDGEAIFLTPFTAAIASRGYKLRRPSANLPLAARPEPMMNEDPRILRGPYEKVWKINRRRDQMHAEPANWEDEPPKNGQIRPHCKFCAEFVGDRDADPRPKHRH